MLNKFRGNDGTKYILKVCKFANETSLVEPIELGVEKILSWYIMVGNWNLEIKNCLASQCEYIMPMLVFN